ncbi:MAG: PhzF family phenazine biosynthesis protein [Paracoccaceae bacterium]|nr:PhzF family phenazine biosynthesis protein [Paracoccaceae bacterium]
MNRAFALDWVDAFADRPFGGNGCAVVHDGGTLDDETCMALVRETSLTECTFVGASEAADWKVRYFLAGKEIPFAGHPTLATVASLAERGMVRGGRVVLETGAGAVPVEVGEDGRITMTQKAPEFGEEVPGSIVADVVGLGPGDVVGMPQVVSTGLPFCITVLRDHAALRRARLDAQALTRFRAQFDRAPQEVMEPFLVTLQGATARGRTFARLLLDPPSPPEDPFTGSATGAMAAYLWARGLIDSPRFTAEQGHWTGRPGSAEVEVLGPRDAIAGVRVAGRAHVLIRGELRL